MTAIGQGLRENLSRAAVAGGVAAARLRRLLRPARGEGAPRVVFFAHLSQDVAVLAPLLAEAARRRDLVAEAWATARLQQTHPASLELLGAAGTPVRIVGHQWLLLGAAPGLAAFDALVTASESSAPPHRVGHALTRVAEAAGLATFTLQHGLENVGLTYFDAVHRQVRFASRTVLTWAEPDGLPAEVPEATRAKCLAVGRPDSLPARGLLPGGDGRPLVCVFENLHWHRYDEAYRAAFFDDLERAAGERRDLRFLLRPHPAIGARSADHARRLGALQRVEVLEPGDPDLGQLTAAELAAGALAVVTTPSTAALDAACAGRPVAVAAYGLALPAYRPLPLLARSADWLDFLEGAAEGREELQAAGREFRDRVRLPGDAAARALDRIVEGARG